MIIADLMSIHLTDTWLQVSLNVETVEIREGSLFDEKEGAIVLRGGRSDDRSELDTKTRKYNTENRVFIVSQPYFVG